MDTKTVFSSPQLKSVGPKLVPFFKTVAIFFVLFGNGSSLSSIFYCIIKCLPIVSLMIFVLLHGMNFSEAYAYSRKVLLGLIFSCIGDAFLVWKHSIYFMCGIVMFALAQLMYTSAVGLKPFNPYAGTVCAVLAVGMYTYMLPGMTGAMVYLGAAYCVLIFTMVWRAVARVQFFDDLWTWTKLCSCMGAICFVVSDIVISLNKFCFPVPHSHIAIMSTYYAAQLGIALSVVDSQVLHKKTE